MVARENAKDVYKIVICDDNPEQLEQMRCICCDVMHLPDDMVVVYRSGVAMDEALRSGKLDCDGTRLVAFLDIEMDELDGVQLGRNFHELMPESVVVFITAHPEYAIKGYEARAFRYLLKPLTQDSVGKVMGEIRREFSENKSIRLKLSGAERPICLDDILYISAEDKYAIIYTTDGHITARESLLELERELEQYGFFRIHRKYLVNMRYHRELCKGKLILSDGNVLPVSRRRENMYRDKIMEKMEKDLNG